MLPPWRGRHLVLAARWPPGLHALRPCGGDQPPTRRRVHRRTAGSLGWPPGAQLVGGPCRRRYHHAGADVKGAGVAATAATATVRSAGGGHPATRDGGGTLSASPRYNTTRSGCRLPGRLVTSAAPAACLLLAATVATAAAATATSVNLVDRSWGPPSSLLRGPLRWRQGSPARRGSDRFRQEGSHVG